jgi:hypothetical protein
MASKKIDVQNLNHPNLIKSVDAAMYAAMRKAYLDVVPADGPGLTLDAIRERLRALLPEDLFPGAAKANWWARRSSSTSKPRASSSATTQVRCG